MGTQPFDAVVRSSRVLLGEHLQPASLVLQDGCIAAVERYFAVVDAFEILDFADCVVLPGLVDPHVHFKDPGFQNYREDFLHGTRQAAAGGVTTILEMPFSKPPVTDVDTLLNKIRTAQQNACVDFGLWGALNATAQGAYNAMHQHGCMGFKAFLCPDPNGALLSDAALLQAMSDIEAFGGLVGVHAENASITQYLTETLKSTGRTDGLAYAASRPELAETEAVQRALLFAHHTRCKLHICHLSSPASRDLLAFWRGQGADCTVETALPYLMLDETDLERCGGHAKCGPPLRSPQVRHALWDMVLEDAIDFIVTDHCPFVDADREGIWDALSGLAGLELFLPLLVDEGIHRRNMGYARLARLTSEHAARRFGLYPKKGVLQVGSDADMAVLEPDREWSYTGKNSFSKTQSLFTPYEGRRIRGKVVCTLLRGKTVFKDDRITALPGYGEMLFAQH